MKILAIDPGTVTGIAIGDPGQVPNSYSIVLTAVTAADQAAFLFIHLHKYFMPDQGVKLIVIEHFLSPNIQPAIGAVTTSLMAHGAVAALARLHECSFIAVHPITWRKCFLGKVPRGRDAIKLAVLAKDKELGYLEDNVMDLDRAEAIGIWHYAQGSGLFSDLASGYASF